MIQIIRSFLFDIALYTTFIFIMIVIGPFYLFVLKDPVALRRWSSRLFLKGLRFIVGLDCKVTGYNNIPDYPCIFACKHQSAWETVAMMSILPGYGIVLKQELLKVPLFGYYLRASDAVGVDRKKGLRAIVDMGLNAKKIVEKGSHILIFPEGTRGVIGEKEDYKAGVYGLYKALNIPVVPIALNSGLFWPRRAFVKKKGCIEVEILPTINPGLLKDDFMNQLVNAIESSCQLMPSSA